MNVNCYVKAENENTFIAQKREGESLAATGSRLIEERLKQIEKAKTNET